MATNSQKPLDPRRKLHHVFVIFQSRAPLRSTRTLRSRFWFRVLGSSPSKVAAGAGTSSSWPQGWQRSSAREIGRPGNGSSVDQEPGAATPFRAAAANRSAAFSIHNQGFAGGPIFIDRPLATEPSAASAGGLALSKAPTCAAPRATDVPAIPIPLRYLITGTGLAVFFAVLVLGLYDLLEIASL